MLLIGSQDTSSEIEKSVFFLWRFWSTGFPSQHGLFSSWHSSQFQATSLQVLLLLFWGSFAYLASKARSFLGHRSHQLPERFDGSMPLWCLNLHIMVWTDERGTSRHLEIAPKDEPWLVKVCNSFPGVLVDFSLFFFMVSCKEAFVFEGQP